MNTDPSSAAARLRQVLMDTGAYSLHQSFDYGGRLAGSVVHCSFDAHELSCPALPHMLLLVSHEYRLRSARFDLGWGYRDHFVNFVNPLHLIPPGTAFRWVKDGPARVSLLTFDQQAALEMFEELGCERPVDGMWSLAQRGFVSPLVYTALGAFVRDLGAGQVSRLLSDSFGALVLNELGKKWRAEPAAATAPRLSPQALRKVTRYMDEHLAEDISLAELAALCGLSRYHFLRCFKAAQGVSPYRHLTAMRVERARHLLATTGQPVSYVASVCGFASAGAMGRALKKALGSSASAYRATAGHYDA
ncbi:AraC family transcriptional regulator [Pigmentiphaga kullae]|uniref:AraC family transcriptional regulator n=1 Tax=Pigmentiphaga kullae TaxID=151784 RepID=A0A4Q7NDI1_9BURK|nr:AraC family transcriptional regulator [Pigmentiphaga kullae]RZS81112.1 AraC family transcriptional regulator [Pigmentiphaga kullae]